MATLGRQGTRLRSDTNPARPRRRGYRTRDHFAAVQESGDGPERQFAAVQRRVRYEGSNGLEMLTVSLSHLNQMRTRQRTSSVIASPSDERFCDIFQRRHLPASMA
jgi:hypothetical protein